jgi:lycopene beta-cyclase
MSYLAFHLVFISPPLLLLVPAARRAAARYGARAWWTLPALSLIALLYTTPWDNYLVYRGIWWYGTDRVLGTIGYVPVEEYLFFVLQPLLTGAWTYAMFMRAPAAAATAARAQLQASVPITSVHVLLPRCGARALGVTFYLLVLAGGALALTYESGLYLGLILVWAAPILAAQWAFMARSALRAPGAFALAIVMPTLYLWIADRVAIAAGIWTISGQYTTGLHLAGLPIEEAVFFLATNTLVVQGVLLFLQPGMRTARAPRLRQHAA